MRVGAGAGAGAGARLRGKESTMRGGGRRECEGGGSKAGTIEGEYEM